MRRQLVVRPGPLGTRGCQAATTRAGGLCSTPPPCWSPCAPRDRTGPAAANSFTRNARHTARRRRSAVSSSTPPRRMDQDPARQRLPHRRSARALRPARCSGSSLLHAGQRRVGASGPPRKYGSPTSPADAGNILLRVPDHRILAAPLASASTRWRVQVSHFGAVQVRPGVSAFWWRSCLAVPGTRLAAGLGA